MDGKKGRPRALKGEDKEVEGSFEYKKVPLPEIEDQGRRTGIGRGKGGRDKGDRAVEYALREVFHRKGGLRPGSLKGEKSFF